MSFIVNRKVLLNELALLQTVAETKTTLPVLAYIKFEFDGERLVLTATNIDVSIITEIQAEGEAWSGCLPSAQLYALVKLLADETISFQRKDDRMEIKAGKAKHKLPVLPVTDFPAIERHESEGVAIDAATFSQMLDHVAFASLVPSDGIKASNQKYTGVDLSVKEGQLQLAATNITRFATVSHSIGSSLSFEVIIPNQAIGPLAVVKDGSLSIDVSPHHAHFANGPRHIYTRLIDDRFPDWKSLFPKSYEHTAEIASADLGAAIKRAMLTQGEGRLIIVGLRWTWASDELLIETRGGDRGKSDEVVSIACPSLNGSSVALGMNGQQVLDALPLLGEKVMCTFSDGTFIVELKPQQPSPINFVYYINTVTLKHWQ